MTTIGSTEITTVRAVVTFAGGYTTRRFSVAHDGTVFAWDDVAGHYTRQHSLSPAQERRLRSMARGQ